MKKVEFKHFECSCSSPDHLIRFVYLPEDNYNGEELYMDVQLNHTYSFFKRIWLAIKYILGYTKKYGHWDCVLIKPEDYEDLILMFKRAQFDHKQRHKKVEVKKVKKVKTKTKTKAKEEVENGKVIKNK